MTNIKTNLPTVIEHVHELLNQGRPKDALKLIEHIGQTGPAAENARGVCLMRLGEIKEAVSVLSKVAFRGYVCMPDDTPVCYQLNFATAMLLSNQKEGAFDILNKLDEKEYPQTAKLKNAIKQWIKSLNFFEKSCYRIGICPDKSVRIDFPPGEV